MIMIFWYDFAVGADRQSIARFPCTFTIDALCISTLHHCDLDALRYVCVTYIATRVAQNHRQRHLALWHNITCIFLAKGETEIKVDPIFQVIRYLLFRQLHHRLNSNENERYAHTTYIKYYPHFFFRPLLMTSSKYSFAKGSHTFSILNNCGIL